MMRGALTVWFTITTLLGPGMCCCLFGASTLTSVQSSQTRGNQLAPAAMLVKSCCDRSASAKTADAQKSKHNSDQSPPAKCPCEKGKQISVLPPTAGATADLAAQLKLIDTQFVGLHVPFVLAFVTIASPHADTSQPRFRLAGRDLLAAYSVLRC